MVGPFIFFDQMGPAEFLIGARHRRAPASAYRPRHGHLPFRGRGVPSRQPGHLARHPAGRGQPDDGRPRHRAFRARDHPGQAGDAAAVRHPGLGGAAQIARGGGAGLRPSWHRPAAAHHRRGQARAPRHGRRLRSALTGRIPVTRPVRGSRAGAGRRAAAGPRLRRARGLHRLRRDRHRGRHVHARPAARVQARGSHLDPGERPVAVVLLGGEPMDSARHIWWNFVSSSKERIQQAKEDWRRKRFALVPGDDKEFIPLPE